MNFQTLPLLLLLALPVVVQAQFSYTTNDGGITITGFTGPGGSVTIPGEINGLPVTIIGNGAFQQRGDLSSVTIPDSVLRLEDSAFAYCQGLTSLELPQRVTSIGYSAFYRCDSLISITIPDSVTSVGCLAFGACYSLTKVTLPCCIKNIDCGMFYACVQLDGLSIPNSVTNIGDLAFAQCNYLRSVTIPRSVARIGQNAFSQCTSLTNISIPDSVTRIDDNVFANCWSLATITLPASVTHLGEGAFASCVALVSLYFEGNAPSVSSTSFQNDPISTVVYYHPGTTGWSITLGGQPTAQWVLPNPLILNNGPRFGVQTDSFGFTISWARNASVVVEANTNLGNSSWVPVGTNTLINGSSYFSDPVWTNYPARFYRLRSP